MEKVANLKIGTESTWEMRVELSKLKTIEEEATDRLKKNLAA